MSLWVHIPYNLKLFFFRCIYAVYIIAISCTCMLSTCPRIITLQFSSRPVHTSPCMLNNHFRSYIPFKRSPILSVRSLVLMAAQQSPDSTCWGRPLMVMTRVILHLHAQITVTFMSNQASIYNSLLMHTCLTWIAFVLWDWGTGKRLSLFYQSISSHLRSLVWWPFPCTPLEKPVPDPWVINTWRNPRLLPTHVEYTLPDP